MKKTLVVAIMAVASSHVYAMSCDELKDEISKKIEANGVKSYSLDIVKAEEAGTKKVVGSCEGGTKKIVYERK